MPGIFEKLNVLVKANLSLGRGERTSRRRHGTAQTGSPAADVAALRQRVEQALAEDDRLVEALAEMQQTIDDLDRLADEALSQGDDASARQAIRQMQLKQQALALLEAERSRHQMATLELIHQVNTLEALLAEAERQSPSESASEARLAERLQQAHDALSQLARTSEEAEPSTVNEQAVEDDLARRRARLSL